MIGEDRLDVLVVGAGFGGLYALHVLRERGFEVRAIEAASGVGGTWFWNRYPGARCDVESLDYSFSLPELQQEWTWTERYATQPEILAYLEYVADRLKLRPLITFDTRVTSASWREDERLWRVETSTGAAVSARYLILATGSLSAAKPPDIPGVADFQGRVLNTSSWPHEPVDFTGQRVGVVGTGSSGIQAIPILAAQAKELVVFQRTAAFSVPARNRSLDPDDLVRFKAGYDRHRRRTRNTANGVIFRTTGKAHHELDAATQQSALEDQWARGGADYAATFTNLVLDERSNAIAADFVREKIRSSVKDPDVAHTLTPTGFPIASKRLCLDTDYYETFNRPNVRLIDVKRNPIIKVFADGVQTKSDLVELDVLVLATGFDAITGAISRIDITGVDGMALRDKWAAGPLTYMGLMIAGFPNLFMVTGPGSPSVLTNMVASIEQHIDWIADCLVGLHDNDRPVIQADEKAETAWVERVNSLAARTLFVKGDSWYLGANVPGKARVFMPYVGGLAEYREICDRVAASGYDGFILSA